MSDNLKKFMEEVSKDRALMEKAKNADADRLIAIAKEINLELTEEDLKAPEKEELSDDELAAVAGGGGCFCGLAGLGRYDGIDCRCALGGAGFCDAETSYCTGHGNAFCICAIAGGGATDGKECVGNWKG